MIVDCFIAIPPERAPGQSLIKTSSQFRDVVPEVDEVGNAGNHHEMKDMRYVYGDEALKQCKSTP